jgi:hypothetical protein
MFKNAEYVIIWKAELMTYFEVLSPHSTVETEENYEKLLLG